MRIAFAGTPEFAVAALDALRAAGHEIGAVFTQPDRPAGRGRRLTASPVGARAAEVGLPVYKPERFDASAQDVLRTAGVDCMVVAAYGLILPQAALDIPRLGCLNIHASLLPRWRGAAPIQRAIEAGDAQTGICIMQMEAGLDTGPVWRRAETAISAQETAGELHDRLAALGAREITQALDTVGAIGAQPEPQPAQGVTYARKLDKAEARIHWQSPATAIVNAIRAFNPVPMAWTTTDGETRLRVLRAESANGVSGAPGEIIDVGEGGIVVAAGNDGVRLIELQWAGGRALPAAQAAIGRLRPGQSLQ